VRRALSLWGPVVLYMAVIFHASSQPDLPLPPGLTDKPTHSLAYTFLGVLIVRALAGGLGMRIAASTALLGILLTTAYGATDEIHQMFVPGRYADWADLVADGVGGAIGAVVCWLCGIIRASRAQSRDVSRHGL
jgi:VanZ family protein